MAALTPARPATPRDWLTTQVAIRAGRLDVLRGVRRLRTAVARRLSRGGLIAVRSGGVLMHIPVPDSQQIVLSLRTSPVEPYLANLLSRYAQPGAIVVDGGANIGAVSLFAAAVMCGQGKIIAFEPDARNRQALLASVERAQASNVHVSSYALGSGPSAASFWRSDHGALSSLVQRTADDQQVTVLTVALDSYLSATLGAAHADVVKLDLEGGEAAALNGMQVVLATVKLLVFEVNVPQLRNAGHDPVAVAEAYIAAGGFGRVSIADDLTGEVTPWNRVDLNRILAASNYCNVVCER